MPRPQTIERENQLLRQHIARLRKEARENYRLKKSVFFEKELDKLNFAYQVVTDFIETRKTKR